MQYVGSGPWRLENQFVPSVLESTRGTLVEGKRRSEERYFDANGEEVENLVHHVLAVYLETVELGFVLDEGFRE